MSAKQQLSSESTKDPIDDIVQAIFPQHALNNNFCYKRPVSKMDGWVPLVSWKQTGTCLLGSFRAANQAINLNTVLIKQPSCFTGYEDPLSGEQRGKQS